MVKVALFFDGKNFYKGLERATADRYFDYDAGARWLVQRVGGDRFVGAHYYTGIYRELPGEPPDSPASSGLRDFLDSLEMRDGFFVYRFPRRLRTRECPHCRTLIEYTEEKEVDTRIVSDMLGLAATGTYDTAVLLAGDADHAPALEALRALGKIVYVATWGERDLARRLRRAAFGYIDLIRELPHETWGRPAGASVLVPPQEPVEETAAAVPASAASAAYSPGISLPPLTQDEVVLRELRRAEDRFGATGGFVGYHYFLTRWRGFGLDENPAVRVATIDRLRAEGLVELFDREGTTALRSIHHGSAPLPPGPDSAAPEAPIPGDAPPAGAESTSPAPPPPAGGAAR